MTSQNVRYQFSNHLGSASLELDETGALITYEEYYPYGSTSFQMGPDADTVSQKRYRYTGKERDEGTGFYYHGARYYIPWLARWAAPDPILSEAYNHSHGQPDRSASLQHVEMAASDFGYCNDNPVRFTDPTGEVIRVQYGNKGEYYDYTPGVKPTVDDKSVQTVHEAISYSMNARVANDMWTQIANADQVLIIKANYVDAAPLYANDDFKPAFGSQYKGPRTTNDGKAIFGTVTWDPEHSAQVSMQFGFDFFGHTYAKGLLTPTSILAHEGGHALKALAVFRTNDITRMDNFVASMDENLGKDDQYEKIEERRNETEFEHVYIKQINAYEQRTKGANAVYQPIRFNHEGSFRSTKVKINEVADPELYNNYRKEAMQNQFKLNDGVN